MIFSKLKIIMIVLGIIFSLTVYFLFHKKVHNEKAIQWFSVQPRLATLYIHKYGKMSTGKNVSITAPFDGKILATFYQLGDKVTKGQQLLQLSTDTVTKKLHDAQSDYLKKKEEYKKLLSWNSGADVEKAKQSLLDAERQYKMSQDKLKDDMYLFTRGIISRDELNQQKEMVEQNKQQIASAKYALDDTLAQGSSNNVLVAQLAMTDAKSTLKLIQKQIKQAVLVSPATGIALKPIQNNDRDSSGFEAVIGEAVTENQNLLTIGDSETLKVVSSFTQDEVNKISQGMQVKVKGDAFPDLTLTGRIVSISKLANDEESEPSFPFTVIIDNFSEKFKRLMRIGLMVEIDLEIYRKPNALIVPIASICTHNHLHYVWLKKKGHKEKRFVKLGPTLPDGIVVRSGLNTNDEIQVMSE